MLMIMMPRRLSVGRSPPHIIVAFAVRSQGDGVGVPGWPFMAMLVLLAIEQARVNASDDDE